MGSHPALNHSDHRGLGDLDGLEGGLLGSLARNPQEAGSFSLLATFLLTALGPVVIPDPLPAS